MLHALELDVDPVVSFSSANREGPIVWFGKSWLYAPNQVC